MKFFWKYSKETFLEKQASFVYLLNLLSFPEFTTSDKTVV